MERSLDVNKLIMETLESSLQEDKNDVEQGIQDIKEEMIETEQTVAESLMMMALPAAISAGLGALNLRKVESGEIYEVDWEEMASKAGKIAGKVGSFIKNKAESAGDGAGKGLKIAGKFIKRGVEDLSDKATGNTGMMTTASKFVKRKTEDIAG